MTNPFALVVPLVLLLPTIGQAGDVPYQSGAPGLGIAQERTGSQILEGPVSSQAPDFETPPEGPYSQAGQSTSPLEAFQNGQIARQVRIEQRVIIRITPQRPTTRNNLLAQLPQRGINTRYVEREMDDCVPVSTIAGVQTGTGNRLLLFLSDERVVSLNLERACRARDFYSGFYVERNEDGQLCVSRDELQSRSGARCEIERMRQLVEADEQ